MARHKDTNWNLETPHPGMNGATLAVLMDIRDELKMLNGLLHCSNFVGIPSTLKAIDRKLRTPRKKDSK